MTVTQRHELQQDIAISHVLSQRNRAHGQDVRKLMAYWMRQARRLSDPQLVRIAASL